MTLIEQHDLTERVCIELLGWKWLSFDGTPLKSHPKPSGTCRVRQLFSANQLADPSWQEVLAERNVQDATGNEPLAAAYDSGRSVARQPRVLILVDTLFQS